MEDQNRFIPLAKDTETRTPSTGSKNNKFVSGLKFSSINVNGIRSNKLELLAYLDFHQPQMVAIQETKIDSSISTSELFPETCPYNVYRKDRNSKGGGVMLLIHKDISHMPITELENDSESVWVKVFTNKTSHFVASWYQPPGRNLAELTSEIDLLRSQLQKIKCMHKGNKPPSVHVLGDYREIKDIEDTLKLQKDIDRLGIWARKWGMRFQPVKCNMMQLTNKHNKIQASYTLEGTVLENVDSIKYLGVTITSDLKWNSHIRNVCSKANRTLGFLRRNLFSCPKDVKEAAYKSMVRPILEYGSTDWDPHYNGLNDELENVQKRAARFVTRNYSYETGSMTGILEELKWETLQKRRKDNRLILLYKGLKGKARIPTDDLIPKNRRCRNQHSLVFQIPSASIDAYLKSFFPKTIRDWNVLPDSLISSAELSDDCVSKFTSLVRARD